MWVFITLIGEGASQLAFDAQSHLFSAAKYARRAFHACADFG
jgi:hypothetical protein